MINSGQGRGHILQAAALQTLVRHAPTVTSGLGVAGLAKGYVLVAPTFKKALNFNKIHFKNALESQTD
jgi:hypothetical protein